MQIINPYFVGRERERQHHHHRRKKKAQRKMVKEGSVLEPIRGLHPLRFSFYNDGYTVFWVLRNPWPGEERFLRRLDYENFHELRPPFPPDSQVQCRYVGPPPTGPTAIPLHIWWNGSFRKTITLRQNECLAGIEFPDGIRLFRSTRSPESFLYTTD